MLETLLFIKRGPAHESFKKDDWHYSHQIYEPVAAPFFKSKYLDGEKKIYFARSHTARRPPFNGTKLKDEVRIFVMGESVGDGIGKWLKANEEMFLSRFPGYKVNVVNVAVGAYTSAHVFSVAGEVLEYEPDLVLILMGNNIIRSIDKRTWKLIRRPPRMRWLYLNSWIYRSIVDRIYYHVEKGYYGNEEFKQDYKRLAEMVSGKNIPFVVFTLPANYADTPPHPVEYFSFEKEEYLIPKILIETGRFNQAYELINPGTDGYLWFMKGDALREMGKYTPAREAYLKALELECYGRVTPEINKIIRDVGKKYGSIIIEADKLFEDASETGLVGNNMLYDKCHWYEAYNYLLFDELIREINRIELADAYPVPEENLPDRKSLEKIKNLVEIDKETFFADFWLPHGINSAIEGSILQSVYMFREVIKQSPEKISDIPKKGPDDYIYIFEDMPWIKHNKDLLTARWPMVLSCGGEALREEGYLEEALGLLDAAVKENPTLTEAYIFRALVYMNMGNKEEAVENLRRADNVSQYGIRLELVVDLIL